MAISANFYTTSGMATPVTSIPVLQSSDGTSAAVNVVVYLGSSAAGKKFRAQSNPGVDQITVSVADAAPSWGLSATAIKLATSAEGLATATAGAALSIGTQLLSGVGNAQAIHIRIDTPAIAVGHYTDLSLVTNSLQEEAV